LPARVSMPGSDRLETVRDKLYGGKREIHHEKGERLPGRWKKSKKRGKNSENYSKKAWLSGFPGKRYNHNRKKRALRKSENT